MTVFKTQDTPIIYPSSDGKPMAENTVQFDWLVTIKSGLEEITQNQTTFIAGDLFWYPVEGNNRLRLAPDVMAAIGRPKGHRSSYLQWREANIPPQLVIEILSPGNTKKEMESKLAFYERYGVEEYIVYYPQKNTLTIYERTNNHLLVLTPTPQNWTSSILGFHLQFTKETLIIQHSDGRPFQSHLEVLADKMEAITQKEDAIAEKEDAIAEKEDAIAEKEDAIAEKQIVLEKLNLVQKNIEAEKQKTEKERQEKLILAKKLKELGINPDEILNK